MNDRKLKKYTKDKHILNGIKHGAQDKVIN